MEAAGAGARHEEEEEEEGEVACECCGFTEECTARYIAGVRARYGGRWICGLCGDAVAEEMGRAAPAISPAEALDRHARVCGAGRGALAPPSPGPDGDDLIAALRLLLRRRLGSPPRPPQQQQGRSMVAAPRPVAPCATAPPLQPAAAAASSPPPPAPAPRSRARRVASPRSWSKKGTKRI